jgi:hypothetical protein
VGYRHLLQWRAAPGKRDPERGLLGCALVGRTTVRRATALAGAGSSDAAAALCCALEPAPGLLRGDPRECESGGSSPPLEVAWLRPPWRIPKIGNTQALPRRRC